MLLKNSEVSLRALEPEDIDIIYEWENDTDIWQVSNTLTPYSKYILAKYIAQASVQDIYEARQLRMVITLSENNIPVGLIDLFDFDPSNSRAGIGISINRKDMRGKHIAKNALRILIDYCFNRLNINQLYCNIEIDNTASINLFKSENFQLYGTLKQWQRTQNGFNDVFVFGLIKNQNR